MVIVVVAGWGKVLRRKFLAWLIVRADAPPANAIAELLSTYPDPVPFLNRLWSTGKVAHRSLILEVLRLPEERRVAVDSRLEPIYVQAAADPDSAVREMGLSLLADQKSPALLACAQAQLRSADPEVRLLGLQYLLSMAQPAVVPVFMSLLDDPDLRVVTTADTGLRKVTGIDYGVRVLHAYSGNNSGDPAADAAARAKVHAGVQQRKAWWEAHRSEYPSPVAAPPDTAPRAEIAKDFALEDLSGHTVSLSSFRGKVVLLNFWATWCGACLAETPDLVELQKRHRDDLIVLGISLDGAPDEHGHGDGDDHDDDPSTMRVRAHQPAAGQCSIQSSPGCADPGITYRVLLDPKSTVGTRFNGGELPTNVLIDASGRVRRRFVGARPLPVWESMLAEMRP